MSKKKGTTVPLDQFLKPDTKITSWAEDEDFDADCTANAARPLVPSLGPILCGVTELFLLGSALFAVPTAPAPVPARPETRAPAPAASAESLRSTFYDLPDHPPYKVYIGNVPYELQQGDLVSFFRGLQVKRLQLTGPIAILHHLALVGFIWGSWESSTSLCLFVIADPGHTFLDTPRQRQAQGCICGVWIQGKPAVCFATEWSGEQQPISMYGQCSKFQSSPLHVPRTHV